MNKKRDQNVDIYRGLAILLILAGHLYWTEYIASYIYSFHLALFFIVTGFFIERSSVKYSITEYIKSRTKSILLPYFAALSIYLLAVISVKFRELGLISAFLELGKVFFLSSSEAIIGSRYQIYYWFMPLFFVYTIVLFLLFKYFKKHYFLVYVFSIFISYIVLFLSNVGFYDNEQVVWSIDKLPLVLPLGIFGHALWKKRKLLYNHRNKVLVITGLISLLGFYFKTDLRILFVVNLTAYYILSINGGIFILAIGDFLDKNLSSGAYSFKSLLVVLGQNTMLLYLVHGIVLPLWHGRMGSPEGYSTLFNLTAIIMSISLTFIVKYFIEVLEYGYQNYLKKFI